MKIYGAAAALLLFLLGGMKLATTRIMPLHVGKGRTESCAIADILDYAANPEKTDGGRLISSFGCDSRVADAEFLLAKRQYVAATGAQPWPGRCAGVPGAAVLQAR